METLLRIKPTKIFNLLNNIQPLNASKISTLTQTTYSHTHDLLKRWEKKLLITRKTTGRQKKIYLTTKGKELQQNLQKIKEILKDQ